MSLLKLIKEHLPTLWSVEESPLRTTIWTSIDGLFYSQREASIHKRRADIMAWEGWKKAEVGDAYYIHSPSRIYVLIHVDSTDTWAILGIISSSGRDTCIESRQYLTDAIYAIQNNDAFINSCYITDPGMKAKTNFSIHPTIKIHPLEA